MSGALIDFFDVVVEINAPKCVIATATYGSEVSPEVQFLRNFRDNMILKTNVGSNFMLAFNVWYYSFSPTVAQSIAGNFALKTGMKYVLYPVISILRFGASAFKVFPGNPEAGAVISGLMISSLIGATYITFPITLILTRTRRAKLAAKRLEKPAAVAVVAGLVTLTLAEFAGGPSIVLVLAASVLVLATIALSGLLTSRILLQTLSVIRRKF
jgi:peptide/nickel transport system substrate-binding protein